MPALQREGIVVLNHAERNAAQRKWVAALLRDPGAAAAGAGEPGPQPPVSAGGQQVAQLHRPARRARRLRARQPDRHRQGAARAAARDPPARRAVPGAAGLRAADQRHARPPGRAVPGARGGVVLAVPRHPRLRPGRRGRRRRQPAPGHAQRPDHAALRSGDPARGGQHLPAGSVRLPARAVLACPRWRCTRSTARSTWCA